MNHDTVPAVFANSASPNAPAPPRRSPRAVAFVAHFLRVSAAAVAVAVLGGCVPEQAKYETSILYEAGGGGSLGQGFTHEIQLPDFDRTFMVLNRVQFSDLHIADVIAVRATPVMTSDGQPSYDVVPIQPPKVAEDAPAVKNAPATPPDTFFPVASSAKAAPPASSAKPDEPVDLSIPMLLVRLTPAASREFLSHTLNASLTRRHVFLYVNRDIAGIYRITGPVQDGVLLFNHQLPVPPESADRALYDLARDINESIVIRKKAAKVK